MKVSIITVTLNSEKYILDCIDSVRRQLHPDIEHIIVDGKSSDATLSILRKNRHRFSVLISETDRGMYDAINKGIQVAQGDIIGVLNSDDMLADETVISGMVKVFLETGTDSVYGDLQFVEAENLDKICRFWKGKPYKRSRIHFGWMPAHPTFYMRRDLIADYGLYENHFYTAADYEFMTRYLFKYRISSTYLNQLVVTMRAGGASNGSLKKWLRANRRDYLAMKKNQIPFAFFVSILKPLIKIRQFRTIFDSQESKKAVSGPIPYGGKRERLAGLINENAEFI